MTIFIFRVAFPTASVISALVPLSEVLSYQADLKSMTGGEGSYKMHFDHYDYLPPAKQKELIALYDSDRAEGIKHNH